MNPISNFTLYNQYGMLDPSRPFAPFGIQPEQGSYLMVESPEFLIQRPESVTLRIEWQNIPSSFKIGASFLSGGQWQPLDLPDSSLFRTVPGNPFLVSEFVLEPLKYEDAAERFLRLELTETAFGFGAGRYAKIVSDVALKNASSLLENPPGEQLPLPNPPLTPIAAGISIFLGFAGHSPVADAGTILVWPFLNTLFERAGIQTSDRLDHLRAVSLLLYLTWGGAYQEHRASSVPKILSGLPPDSALPPTLPLTDDEMNLCNGLLTAFTSRWDVVKNTSIEGIRGTFLQRNGRLLQEEDRFVLTVERKTFDILLDKLPWSFGLVKTPWMNQALEVKWR